MSSWSRVVLDTSRDKFRPEVAFEVWFQFPDFELTSHEPEDATSKANLLISLWLQGGDQVWIEQDVVPPPGAIAELLACAEPWCGHRIWIGRRYEPATLGLVKLAESLRDQQPWLARDALAGKSWQSLDQLLRRALESRGYTWHEHTPAATHLHDYVGIADLQNDPLRSKV